MKKIYTLILLFVILAVAFCGAETKRFYGETELVSESITESARAGQIYLEFEGMDEDIHNAKVLTNGKASPIFGTTQTVDVFDDCVVEIDAIGCGKINVKITGKSSVVETECIGRESVAEDEIKNIGVFCLKK